MRAQAPEKVQYQAVVRDASGNILANQNVSLQISILENSASGTLVFQETHAVTTNGFGLINLEIGSGTVVSGNMATINWGGNDHFVQIEMDETGGTNYQLMGTNQLLSVPYALHAKTVETETQDLDLTGTDLSISNGSTIDLSVLQDGVNDADADPNNEIQTLSFNQSTGELTISGGNFVTLPTNGSGGDNWGTQFVQTDGTLTGDGTGGNVLSVNGDLTDDQQLSLSGTNLTIDNGNTVDLSIVQDGVTDADADPNNELISNIDLNGTNLEVTDAGGTSTVDLSPLQDGVNDADANPLNELITGVALNGNSLEIVDAGGVYSTDLSSLQDGVTDADADPNNEIQSLSLSGNDLSISGGNTITLPSGGSGDNWGSDVVNSDVTLSGDGTSGNPLSVSGDLTDDQQLSLSGTNLTIDGGNTVNLSSLQDGVNDADADPNNEIQSLSLSGNDLSISGGNTVTLPSGSGGSVWSETGNKVYVTSDSIGIGLNNPTYPLEVMTSGLFGTGMVHSDGTIKVGTTTESLSGLGGIGTLSNSHFDLFSNSVTRAIFRSNGNFELVSDSMWYTGNGNTYVRKASTTTAVGLDLNILGQTSTNGSGQGGDLIIGGGSGSAVDGSTQIMNGSNLTLLALDGKIRIGDNSNNGYGSQIVLGVDEIEEKLTVVTGNGYGLLHTNGSQAVGSYVNGSGGWFGTKSNHNLHFFTNDGSSSMTVATNGNVGIGTTSPSNKLHVVGDGEITGDIVAGNAAFGGAGVSSNALEVSGSTYLNGAVSWQAQTKYIGVSHLDWVPIKRRPQHNFIWDYDNNIDLKNKDSIAVLEGSTLVYVYYFQKELNLPEDANVVEITAQAMPGNNAAGQYVTVGLYKVSYSTRQKQAVAFFNVTSASSGAWASNSTTLNETVDNENYYYYLEISMDGNSDAAIGGIKIEYESTVPH